MPETFSTQNRLNRAIPINPPTDTLPLFPCGPILSLAHIFKTIIAHAMSSRSGFVKHTVLLFAAPSTYIDELICSLSSVAISPSGKAPQTGWSQNSLTTDL